MSNLPSRQRWFSGCSFWPGQFGAWEEIVRNQPQQAALALRSIEKMPFTLSLTRMT